MEMEVLISNFKVSSSFRKKRKIISVRKGLKNERPSSVRGDVFKIMEKGELQLDLCGKYTERGISRL